MKNTTFAIILIIFILILYLTKSQYSYHSLDKSIKACIIAQKQTSKSKSIDEIKIYCENEVKKRIKD
tara:strand:+ start:206 stop:406 length:201 start_codon:yes stop_codon:yes gene_type:complete